LGDEIVVVQHILNQLTRRFLTILMKVVVFHLVVDAEVLICTHKTLMLLYLKPMLKKVSVRSGANQGPINPRRQWLYLTSRSVWVEDEGGEFGSHCVLLLGLLN
jgi:hypothetical protein